MRIKWWEIAIPSFCTVGLIACGIFIALGTREPGESAGYSVVSETHEGSNRIINPVVIFDVEDVSA
jgi:hypothetical protein